MGRGTYEPALALGITSPYAHLRRLVVSTYLTTDDQDVEIVSADPVARGPGAEGRAWPGHLPGRGATLAGALVDEIDELVIKLYPVIAGSASRSSLERTSPHGRCTVSARCRSTPGT